MGKDLLIISDREIRPKQEATLTYRLVLPAQMLSHLSLLTGQELRVWWAERFLGKVHLRASLGNCRMYTRYTRTGERRFVVVGQVDTSSYIYRHKPICPLDGLIDSGVNAGCWQVVELDKRQASHFAEQSAMVSPVVLSLQDAMSINRRVLLGYWPYKRTGVVQPRQLWKIFKSHASLSELVRVKGLDPYETSVVAALTEIGVASSIKEILRCMYYNKDRTQPHHFNRDSTRLELPAFISWGAIDHNFILRQPPASPKRVRKNELSIEHEVIVASLARRLESMGLTPYLSTLVDLALIHNRTALLFEVKTVNSGNLLDQVRAAIGQLLEYRFIYRELFDRIYLAIVAPLLGTTSEVAFAEGFVRDCGIGLVVWQPSNSQFLFLEDTLDKCRG